MNTPINLSGLHPVMQQALRPFILSPADRALAADFAGPDSTLDPDAAAHHKANDARALALQIAEKRPALDSGVWS